MAYDFINPTSYEDCHLSTAFQPPSGASQRTIACFFRCEIFGDRKILGYDDIAAALGAAFAFTLEQISSSPYVLFRHNGGNIRFPASGLNIQQHLAAVVPSGATTTDDVLVYIDGASVAGTRNAGSNRTLVTAAANLLIGKAIPGSTTVFDGQIAEVGAWDVALTAAEIASLAKGITCDKARPQSLKFYAPLIRDLQDVKGGLTITNNNGATVADHPRVYR